MTQYSSLEIYSGVIHLKTTSILLKLKEKHFQTNFRLHDCIICIIASFYCHKCNKVTPSITFYGKKIFFSLQMSKIRNSKQKKEHQRQESDRIQKVSAYHARQTNMHTEYLLSQVKILMGRSESTQGRIVTSCLVACWFLG